MVKSRQGLICGLLFWGSARGAPPSAAGDAGDGRGSTSSTSSTTAAGRSLTGRFLHITDLHPDPFYKTYSSTTADAACHRHHGPAGIYGAETSGCDSPHSLINQTFKWINDNIKDDIDFVIWTGDSARHDNDEKIPRTQKQVIQQNEFMVSKFAEVFARPDGHDAPTNDFVIPVVPTFGNNDIMPHNIFLDGPNRWTTKYLDIWRNFIPEAQRHQFQQGGWFSVEVIPGKLAVISLNTIYFFTSNSGVDGCASKHEPGYEHMEWLRIQLQILRDRGMKAILMGHVPPARVDSKESWDETCWQKYTLWVQRYRDIIVGSLYGHMNIDHFMLQDFESINKDTKKGRMASSAALQSESSDSIALLEDGEVTVASASDYLLDLRQAWAQLPAPPAKSNTRSKTFFEKYGNFSISEWFWSKTKIPAKDGKAGKGEKRKYLDKIGGRYAENYAVTHVAPSVVPNYFPTLRIFEYNITGLEHVLVPSASVHEELTSPGGPSEQPSVVDNEFLDDLEYLRDVDTKVRRKHRGKKHKKGPRKYKFKVPKGPSKSAPPGPAYSPQVFTWTCYVQYFANLTNINNDFVHPQQGLKHPTKPHDQTILNPTSTNDLTPHTIFGIAISLDGEIENKSWKEGKHGKHQGKKPRPEPHPKEFEYEVEYDTKKDKGFKDLTVRRWVEYARKIGRGDAKAADVEEYDEHEDEEYEEYEEEQLANENVDEQDYSAELTTGGKKKHKKHKKRKHASKEWFTFVKRAFVGTMDPHEIKEVFGASAEPQELSAEEVIEL
ncbi:Endopolyphosphatase [Cucurbitaria berberidis CBS 394.84]|uniref:Endopolyphosphatase n=1 Tax=Cucurbitaria berberidis CBS 394.84 TaxID=1168544 RepID=A0A9P4L4K5_9PLEO|nr:Endopolyphosphatase [Cucurbitaria berberidis CBS 394.84]KAF1840968.1 Endopolyphosphatase [Cucurbitaria berberidis CBS 394.84]